MPQGKIKIHTKLLESVRAKKKDKGPAISKRGNAPVVSKKARNVQVQKLKRIITKTVNATAEEQIRAVALDGKKTIIKSKIAKSKKNK